MEGKTKMGDRISISFRQGKEESIVLFSHWDGMGLVKTAKKYVKELEEERQGKINPLDRFEPSTVMIDFIRHLTKKEKRIESNYYLGTDANDGDNSDNGHHEIELKEGGY